MWKLVNRQRVIIDGTASEWLPVKSGVPQGFLSCILGPLLFNLFINDLPLYVNASSVSLFADDAKIYRPISSMNDCILLQSDLNRLLEWSRVWELAFNPSKCKVVSFTRKLAPLVG